jgi:hypothetical protein
MKYLMNYRGNMEAIEMNYWITMQQVADTLLEAAQAERKYWQERK